MSAPSSSTSSIWSTDLTTIRYPYSQPHDFNQHPASDSSSTSNKTAATPPSTLSDPPMEKSGASSHTTTSMSSPTDLSTLDIMVAPPAHSTEFHLFVGDLAVSVREQDLQLAFSGFPSLFQTRLVSSSGKSKSRGYAFLSFRDRHDAERALLRNGELFCGRAMRVNWANPKMYKGVCEGLGHVPSQPEVERFAVQRVAATPATSPKAPALSHLSSSVSPSQVKTSAPGPYSSSPPAYAKVLQQTPVSNSTLYVGNLEPNVTQSELTRLFEPFGPIFEVRMHAAARGYAFVKLSSHETAATAIVKLAGVRLHQRPIKVGWEKERRESTTPARSPAQSPPAELSTPNRPPFLELGRSPQDLRTSALPASHQGSSLSHPYGHNHSPHTFGVAPQQHSFAPNPSSSRTFPFGSSNEFSLPPSVRFDLNGDLYANHSRSGTQPNTPSDASRTPALSPEVPTPSNVGQYRISSFGPMHAVHGANSMSGAVSRTTSPASVKSGELPSTPWAVNGMLPTVFGDTAAPVHSHESVLWSHTQPWPSVYHNSAAPQPLSQPVSTLSSATHSPATSMSDMTSFRHSSQPSTATSAVGSISSMSGNGSARHSAHHSGSGSHTAPCTPFSASLGLSMPDQQQSHAHASLCQTHNQPAYRTQQQPFRFSLSELDLEDRKAKSQALGFDITPSMAAPSSAAHGASSVLVRDWPSGPPLHTTSSIFDHYGTPLTNIRATVPSSETQDHGPTPIAISREKGALPEEAPKGPPRVVGWGEGRYGGGWTDGL